MSMITKTRIAIRSLVANNKTYYAGIILSGFALGYLLTTKGELIAYELIKRDLGDDFYEENFNIIDAVDKKGRILDMTFEKK